MDRITEDTQGLSLEDGYLDISYADNQVAKIKTTSIVETLILTESLDMVLVGEGNFTFTIALVALRGSWDGVISTCLEENENNLLSDFYRIKLQSVDFCIKNCLHKKSPDMVISNIKNILSVDEPRDANTIKANVDGTRFLFSSYWREGNRTIVWFQCPWAVSRVDLLISNFLEHMSRQQATGDYVFIGIVTFFPYVKQYKLQNLFRENTKIWNDLLEKFNKKYEFIGADASFIKEILEHGYKHVTLAGNYDIHLEIFEHHTTLVFKRK